MARWFLIAFAITLIVCLAQALPAPQQEATTSSTPSHEIGDTLKNLGDKLNKGLESFQNDPHVKELLQSGKDFFKDGLTKFQEQASKLLPKTDETQKPAQ